MSSLSVYRSNKAFTKARLKKMAAGFVLKQSFNKPARWCKIHPNSYWGKLPDGQYYRRCIEGFKKREDCEAGE